MSQSVPSTALPRSPLSGSERELEEAAARPMTASQRFRFRKRKLVSDSRRVAQEQESRAAAQREAVPRSFASTLAFWRKRGEPSETCTSPPLSGYLERTPSPTTALGLDLTPEALAAVAAASTSSPVAYISHSESAQMERADAAAQAVYEQDEAALRGLGVTLAEGHAACVLETTHSPDSSDDDGIMSMPLSTSLPASPPRAGHRKRASESSILNMSPRRSNGASTATGTLEAEASIAISLVEAFCSTTPVLPSSNEQHTIRARTATRPQLQQALSATPEYTAEPLSIEVPRSASGTNGIGHSPQHTGSRQSPISSFRRASSRLSISPSDSRASSTSISPASRFSFRRISLGSSQQRHSPGPSPTSRKSGKALAAEEHAAEQAFERGETHEEVGARRGPRRSRPTSLSLGAEARLAADQAAARAPPRESLPTNVAQGPRSSLSSLVPWSAHYSGPVSPSTEGSVARAAAFHSVSSPGYEFPTSAPYSPIPELSSSPGLDEHLDAASPDMSAPDFLFASQALLQQHDVLQTNAQIVSAGSPNGTRRGSAWSIMLPHSAAGSCDTSVELPADETGDADAAGLARLPDTPELPIARRYSTKRTSLPATDAASASSRPALQRAVSERAATGQERLDSCWWTEHSMVTPSPSRRHAGPPPSALQTRRTGARPLSAPLVIPPQWQAADETGMMSLSPHHRMPSSARRASGVPNARAGHDMLRSLSDTHAIPR
jgi:hypothetical protein